MTESLLNKKSIAMFQDWATNALKAHPNLNLQIKEYDVFNTDLKDSIDNGKNSLKEKDYEKRRIIGSDKGKQCLSIGHIFHPTMTNMLVLFVIFLV